ncbi:hypothetical protein GCM10009779_52600 [Polymorphospora rubra]
MRADLPGVERAEQLVDPGVDPGQVRRAEVAPGQPGLVGDHAEPQPGGAQPVECLPGTVDGSYPVGVAVVRHVVHERAVAVEQHGVEQDRTRTRSGASRAGPTPGIDLLSWHFGRVPGGRGSKRRFPRAGPAAAPGWRTAAPPRDDYPLRRKCQPIEDAFHDRARAVTPAVV